MSERGDSTMRERGLTGGFRRVTAAALAVLLICLGAGCLRVKDTLHLNADGSGTVEIETVSYLPVAGGLEPYQYAFPGVGQVAYPPLTAEDAKRLFPEDVFTLQVEQKKTSGDETATVVKATFKDVNRLLDSPYARAHSLWMGLDEKTFTVKALTGLQILSNLDAMAEQDTTMVPIPMKDLKQNRDKLHVEFTVKLPGAVKADRAAVKGNAATWTVDASVTKDPAKLGEALKAVMTASCPADVLRFKPVSPVRLDLWSFADLNEAPVDEKPRSVDAEKVRSAAKFVPLTFQCTRCFDLSGEGYGRGNSATLTGVITIPKTLAPQRWGAVQLSEVTDDQGRSLLPPQRGREFDRWRYASRGFFGEPPDAQHRTDARKMLSIPMNVPPPSARALRRLKATVELKYPGARHVIKLKDAVKKVPEPDADTAAQVRRVWSRMQPETALAHPKLQEFGLKIVISDVGFRFGTTTLAMNVTSENAVLTNLQVFDAKGRPWPTLFRGMGEEYVHASVVGRPEGPLSLALLVDGGGATVKFPIDLHDLAITPNELKEPPDKEDKGDD